MKEHEEQRCNWFLRQNLSPSVDVDVIVDVDSDVDVDVDIDVDFDVEIDVDVDIDVNVFSGYFGHMSMQIVGKTFFEELKTTSRELVESFEGVRRSAFGVRRPTSTSTSTSTPTSTSTSTFKSFHAGVDVKL